MTRRLIAPAALALISAMLFVAPAHADPPVCTATITPSGPGIQYVLNHAGSNAVVCITGDSTTPYVIGAPLTLPGPISLVGVGSPVIECAMRTYCIDATAGPSDVDLEDLILQDATKADLQIGASNSATPLTDWTLSGVTATGAGEVGVAMNNASDITVEGSTFSKNGSTPYDATLNPTGDFGLRAVRVDSLTVQSSTFSDNVTIPIATPPAPGFANAGFAGGAKFNTDTNFTVTGNTFTGNAGGGQLWIDIDSHDFHVTNNTIQQTNATSLDGIRAEVSCGGATGSAIANNTVQTGTTAGIELFDSNGVQVDQNNVTAVQSGSYGILMYANNHNPVPGAGCDTAGSYPNANNTATGNTISLTASATGLDGVYNAPGGTSTGNTWAGNIYTVRHCDGGTGSGNWKWWDGTQEQTVNFAGWQGYGQDPGPLGACTSTYPEITSFDPAAGQVGAVVTLHGSGLAAVTAVRFHQVPAVFHIDSDSQVTATVPAGATTGPICLTAPNPSACPAFQVQPPATVTGLDAYSGLPGSNIEIAGTALLGASGVTFGGSPAAAFTVVSDSTIDATAPAGVASGPACVQIQVQGSVCAPNPFTVVPPSAPTITSPAGMFQLAQFPFSWGAVAGADSYLAQWRSATYTKGYKSAPPQSTTGTSLPPIPFVTGQTTCFQVAALDSAGSTPSAETCTAVPLDDTSLTAKGTWTEQTGTQFFGGSAMSSSTKKSTLTLSDFKSKVVALVVEMQPNGGSIEVLQDGKVFATIQTSAPAIAYGQVEIAGSWSTLHDGSLTLRVKTSGRPVVIDGVGLYRGP